MALTDKLLSVPIRHPRVVALALLVAMGVAGIGVSKLSFSVNLLGGASPTIQITVAVPIDTPREEVDTMLLGLYEI